MLIGRQAALLPVKYPPAFFLQLLLMPTRACYVAYKKSHPNIPIGFISAAIKQPVAALPSFAPDDAGPIVSARPRDKAAPDLTKTRLEILTLGVLPSHQQRGLARRLVRRVVDALRMSCAANSIDGVPIFANVAVSNTEALKFYKHIGMEVSPCIIRNLYRTLAYGSKDAYLVVGVI